ncbi:threonine-phosphate decarboxylase [Mycoplasmatota bacterium]|nr:threonine-phosphate decarboxylase [Mycoplasmatota bacterium]
MKWRMHGANPEKLYQQFGITMPKKVIDFSDNGNAIKQDKVLNINYEAYFDQYPDDEVIELRRLISERENIPIENILFSNGTNELIYILASFYQNKTVAILHPTYSEYEKALKVNNVNVDYIYNFEEVKEKHVALFVCNPNNPTGRYFNYDTMTKLAKKLEAKNIDLIIDEAYIDFMKKKHQTLDIKQFNYVYILRSLTKFYHLSGLRIGYVLSHRDNIEEIKNRQPTWSVNSIAQVVSLAYLNDFDFIEKTKEYYEKERNRLFKQLKELGYEVFDSVVNFFVMKIEDDEELIRFLLTKGIVIRHTRNFPSLNGKYVRITIKSIEEDNILIDALKAYARSKH